MIKNFTKFFLFFLFLLKINDFAVAQLPGWVFMKDKDGNSYYIDKIGRIWTSGTPDFRYKPVSYEGLTYYLNQGLALIKREHKAEGLIILRSIMLLPVRDNSVYTAQAKAAKAINSLKKREADRFQKFIDKTQILIIRDGPVVTLVNEKMQYSIKLPKNIDILRMSSRYRHNYTYSGISIGLNFGIKSSEKNAIYDALLAIDSERFITELKDINQLEENWRHNTGDTAFERKALSSLPDRKIYRINGKTSPPYAGFEGYFIRGNSGFFMRSFFRNNLPDENIKALLKVFKEFHM